MVVFAAPTRVEDVAMEHGKIFVLVSVFLIESSSPKNDDGKYFISKFSGAELTDGEFDEARESTPVVENLQPVSRTYGKGIILR